MEHVLEPKVAHFLHCCACMRKYTAYEIVAVPRWALSDHTTHTLIGPAFSLASMPFTTGHLSFQGSCVVEIM